MIEEANYYVREQRESNEDSEAQDSGGKEL